MKSATNDITKDRLVSKAANKNYRDNFDGIKFGTISIIQEASLQEMADTNQVTGQYPKSDPEGSDREDTFRCYGSISRKI